MSEVSVIIPTYNRAHCVTRAIDSALAQTYPDYEIIVVDDGSDDNTKEVLEPYMDKITYIYQENAGVSAARNVGIRAAKGKWVAFLDSDDEWLPEKLSVQMSNIAENPRICLHATNAIMTDEYAKEIDIFRFTGVSKQLNEDSCIIERPLVYQIEYGLARTPCVLIKHKAVIEAGLFDGQLTIYEDHDLMCRLALDGPWGVSNIELVRINRQDELLANLSTQRFFDPIGSFESLVYLYGKLNNNPRLQGNEKQVVTNKLCQCKAALGMELIKKKQKSEARKLFRQVLIDIPSQKSLSRYILSFLPSRITARIVRSWHRFRYD